MIAVTGITKRPVLTAAVKDSNFGASSNLEARAHRTGWVDLTASVEHCL
jgi:hypothetical protein